MSHVKLSLEALEVLDAIARRGSFAGAAVELHRVPSAVTYTIHKLETDLGVQLFDRNSHRARPTEAGIALMSEASQLLTAVAEVEQRTQRIARGLESELRVAFEGIIPKTRMLALATRFFEHVPGVRLTLMCECLTGCWDALRSNRADLAIGAPEYSMPSGMNNIKPLGELNWMFCVPPDHPLTRVPTPVSVTEIGKYRTILIRDSARDIPPRNMGLRAGHDALSVSSVEEKMQAQIDGLGVGFLPALHAIPEINAKRLVEIDVAEPRPPSRLCYAWQSRQVGQALKWFLDQLETPKVRKSLVG